MGKKKEKIRKLEERIGELEAITDKEEVRRYELISDIENLEEEINRLERLNIEIENELRAYKHFIRLIEEKDYFLQKRKELMIEIIDADLPYTTKIGDVLKKVEEFLTVK